MHKHKKSKLIGRASLVLFLLFFVFTQIMPFIPIPKASAADGPDLTATKALTQIIKAEWVTSQGINLTITDKDATFKSSEFTKGTKINVKDYMTTGFVYAGDGIGTDDEGFVFQGYKDTAFECKNAGIIRTRDGGIGFSDKDRATSQSAFGVDFRYVKVDDDTQRIVVDAAGATSGILKIRLADPNKPDKCIKRDMNIKITEPGSTSGSKNIGKWLDSANIKTTIYPGIYKINPGNSKQFISQAGNQGPCKDTLVITGNDDALGTPVVIYDQKAGRNSPINKDCGVAGSTAGYISNNDQAATAPPNSGVADPDALDVKTCESTGSTVLNWVFCAFIDAIDKGVGGVDGIVNNMLSLDTKQIADNNDLHTLWSYFRNIASLLLVVVALVMIIAQSMGNS